MALNDGTSTKVLLSRFLETCEVLTLGISCPSAEPPKPGESGSLSITVDTSRVWNSFEYEIGSGQGADPGTTQATAYSVGQAKEHVGEKGVWVCGYVVGGDLSSAKEGISVLVHDLHRYRGAFLRDHQELLHVGETAER